MKVIGFCGQSGAGKDEAARYLAMREEQSRKHAPSLRHSDTLRRMLHLNNLPKIPARMSALFEAVAAELGPQWIAAEVAATILMIGTKVENASFVRLFLITGIRNPEEVALYRRAFPNGFQLVALHASQPVRYDRVRNRGERSNEHEMTLGAFEEIETLGSNTGEQEVIRQADVQIVNDGTMEEFHAKLEQLL